MSHTAPAALHFLHGLVFVIKLRHALGSSGGITPGGLGAHFGHADTKQVTRGSHLEHIYVSVLQKHSNGTLQSRTYCFHPWSQELKMTPDI